MAIFTATLLFHIPPLLNAAGVHSDAAIVGLQSMHMLHGEWSPFLWGAGYQGSFDAGLIALAFAIFGTEPLVLMAVPLFGHLLLVGFTFGTLRRHLSPWAAALTSIPVLFTPQAINAVIHYAPRQWCITLIAASVFFLDGARERPRAKVWLALGTFLGVFSLYVDLYGLQMLAGVGVFALLCCADIPGWRPRMVRFASCAAGLCLGAILVWLPRQSALASTSQTTLTFRRLAPNWALLRTECLPWLLGTRVLVPGRSLYPQPWEAPSAVAVLQWTGAVLLAVGFLCAVLAPFTQTLPWVVRRLAILWVTVTACAMGGFLVSTMPSDMWSTRYLAPILWTAPFGLAALAFRLRTVSLAAYLLPYAASAALGGWLSYGPYVNGPLPRRDARGIAAEEQVLGQWLRTQGIDAAAAQYWLAYRLTFLWKESPTVVPIEAGEDRYPPYRAQLHQAQRTAYIFHPSEPRASPAGVLPILAARGGVIRHAHVAGFTVLIHDLTPTANLKGSEGPH
ncbi:MAG: hypothetical protein ACT4TC_12170 [Myxococcaceae bacterium]